MNASLWSPENTRLCQIYSTEMLHHKFINLNRKLKACLQERKDQDLSSPWFHYDTLDNKSTGSLLGDLRAVDKGHCITVTNRRRFNTGWRRITGLIFCSTCEGVDPWAVWAWPRPKCYLVICLVIARCKEKGLSLFQEEGYPFLVRKSSVVGIGLSTVVSLFWVWWPFCT